MSIKINYEQRLAHIEKMYEKLNAEQQDVLENAYALACEQSDEEAAAYLARQIRNRRLADSDKELMFDRINFNTESTASFVNSLQAMATSGWHQYREYLRNLPEQEGFPFSIVWPAKPGEQPAE